MPRVQRRFGFLGRYSLSAQLMAAFACLSLVAVATAVASFLVLSHIETHATHQATFAHRMSSLADMIAIDTLQCRRYEKDMFLNLADATVFKKYQVKWTAAYDKMKTAVERLSSITKNRVGGELNESHQAWKQSVESYHAAVTETTAQIESGEIRTPSLANMAMTPHKECIRSLIRKSVAEGVARRALSTQADGQVRADVAQFRLSIGLFAALSLVLGGCLAWFLSSLLTRRAQYICERVERFAAGDYATRIDLEGRDEFSTLGRAIDHMAERIEERTAQAQAADRAKTDFLANMSHEIRTPMTAILGFTDQLLEEGQIDKAPKRRIEAINTIRRNGTSLLEIINDILDLSKIEAGKMTIESGSCQPCQIIAEVASLMRVRADARGLPFNIEYDGAIPETILSDPTRLRQILINLVGNAIKFTESGSVRLVTRFADDGNKPCLQFDVRDTGRGMTQEQVALLFQPFTQADNSTTRKFGGTGLGLTISKRFAELLGGDITVAETKMGAGTTFRATVATGPLGGVKILDNPMSATVVSDTPTAAAQVEPSDFHGVRILLAEDGPDNQRLISFFLKKAGVDVTVVENGKLALDAALAAREEGNSFDCILMDMQMPVMDGYEATGQLRRKDYTGPIIALTAHAMASDREKCIHAGCDDYATKPIDRQRLLNTIGQYLVPAESASDLLT